MNQTLTVLAGASYILESAGNAAELRPPLTVSVFPGSGGTAVVETRTAQTGTWRAVANGALAGTLAAPASDVLLGPVQALRFTAALADAVVEIAR